MYGLSQKEKGPFEFDLEQDLRKDAHKAKELLKKIEEKIAELKNLLRSGSSNSKEFDQLGVLLHGYTALQKVLKKSLLKK